MTVHRIINILLSVALSVSVFTVSADDCEFLPVKPQPGWTFDSPAITGFYTGVGLAEEDAEGADAQIEKARQSAVADLASSIQISVRNSLRIEITQQNNDVDRDIEQLTETITDTSLQDVVVDETWLDRRRCIVWVRVKVSRAAIEAKQHRELQDRKLTLLDSYYDKARDSSASVASKNDALDQAYIIFGEVDFAALKGVTSKAYYKKLLDNLSRSVRGSASAKQAADETRRKAEALLLQASNSTMAGERSEKTAGALKLLKKVIADNPIGSSADRFDGESAAFKIAEVEQMRNNSCEAQFQYEIVRDRTLSSDWKARATQQANSLRCTVRNKKDRAWRRAFDGVVTSYLCATDIAGQSDDWTKPCENLQGFLAGHGALDAPYLDIDSNQLTRLAYRMDKRKQAPEQLKANGRVIVFVAKGKLKSRSSPKNPNGEDHQFSGRIYSYVINNGVLEFKDKYTGTGGWNPVSDDMAIEVLGLNVAKRFRKQYLKHIRNN